MLVANFRQITHRSKSAHETGQFQPSRVIFPPSNQTTQRLHSRLLKTIAVPPRKIKRTSTTIRMINQQLQQNKGIKIFKKEKCQKIKMNRSTIVSGLNKKSMDDVNNLRKSLQSKGIDLKEQILKLGQVEKRQLIDEDFQEKCFEINRHSQFKNTLTHKKQLIFLTPHMKFYQKGSVEQFKATLYNQIHQSAIELNNCPQNPSLIEYFTQYDPGFDKPSKTQLKMNKKMKVSNVLRQKIRTQYKNSEYCNKIKGINPNQTLSFKFK